MFKKLNIIYILALMMGGVLFQISDSFNKESFIFFGFAENKETEINLDHAVEIEKIFVTTGQKVEKGQLLAEVNQNSIDQEQMEINHRISEIEAEKINATSKIESNIASLESKKTQIIGEFDTKILEEKQRLERNKRMLKDIGVNPTDESGMNERLVTLERKKQLSIAPLKTQIKELKKQMNLINRPRQAEIERLKGERIFTDSKANKLSILAPSNGLIGNIHIKEAENVSPFRTLITFYEENPTTVQGFVHESMILKVKVGDTLEVASSLHPDTNCLGVVTGLGSRIIEIPTRLRKVPELKTYGREVLIQIPSNNQFLQKEKVLLNLGANNSGEQSIFAKLFGGSSDKTTMHAQNAR